MGISFTTTLQTTLQSFVQLPTDTNKQQFSMSNANWGLQEIKRLSPDIQREWLAASKKELKFIIKNETLNGGMRRRSRVMKSSLA